MRRWSRKDIICASAILAMTQIDASHQMDILLVWRPKLQWKSPTTLCCFPVTLLVLTVGHKLWSQVNVSQTLHVLFYQTLKCFLSERNRSFWIYFVVLAKKLCSLHWLQVLHWYISWENITWHGIGFHFHVRFHGGTLSSPYPSTSIWMTQSSHLMSWCPMSQRRGYFNCKRLLFTTQQTLTGQLTILEF